MVRKTLNGRGFLGLLVAYPSIGAATVRTESEPPSRRYRLFVSPVVSNAIKGWAAIGAVVTSTGQCVTHVGIDTSLQG